MVKNASLENTVRQLLLSRGVAVLATQGEDYPHACLVAFAATDDLRTLVFNTSRSTRKYTNIRKNHRVTLLVDDRSHREEDFHEASVVTARGWAEEIPRNKNNPYLDLFLKHHPYLADFATSPTSVLIGVHVESYAVVSRFQNVHILNLDHEPDR